MLTTLTLDNFRGVGRGSTKDIENVRCHLVLGPCPLRRSPNPLAQHPPIR
jgi:hypothetical protein